ncbi:glycosyltransferase [Segetibacter sp. 3557_3]|uniref:glycosyltransferase family 4 protein n=1 Tax=Segetibacter sp. 3557_3 TaxID=2547429 RepID=UPI001058950C|nr:glycosyltransferase family 4 protein [Segetibacter sp. 3557_3]TDH24636.1 glycosyltransferase [Segetibacter sp. 3557_3]
MKVGFYFDACHILDFSNEKFERGELGVSGTDSSFLRVVRELAKRPQFDVHLFANGITSFSSVNLIAVSGIDQAIESSKKVNVEVLILNDLKNRERTELMLSKAELLGVSLVIWAHNPVETLDSYSKSIAVRKIIYVETFDLHQTRHKSGFYKGVVIPNGIEKDVYVKKEIELPNSLDVLYLGSLTPSKGFHHLAKAWKTILKEIPEARLIVIGSGKLYNNHAKLGHLGIAEDRYELELAPYIGSEKQDLKTNRIECFGLLNRNEVIELINKCKVACINPNTWGSLESCSVSSLEIQLSGVPIVAGKAGGNLNTILNNKTGLLVENPDRNLPKAIIRLLRDDELNLEMRKAARAYILQKYELNSVINLWVDFLVKLKQGQEFKFPQITSEVASPKLYIKEAIRLGNRILGRKFY